MFFFVCLKIGCCDFQWCINVNLELKCVHSRTAFCCWESKTIIFFLFDSNFNLRSHQSSSLYFSFCDFAIRFYFHFWNGDRKTARLPFCFVVSYLRTKICWVLPRPRSCAASRPFFFTLLLLPRRRGCKRDVIYCKLILRSSLHFHG